MLKFKYINMLKSARKPSSDPVQEKLRQNKALWNKDVSMFINDLIHFKKTMNGAPSKFFQEKSSIKEPVPADPATIIGSLAGDFQELAQKGNSLIEEQLAYSKTRRKSQPKQPNAPVGQSPPAGSETPKPDLSQQLSLPIAAHMDSDLTKFANSLEYKYDLVSEASNPISRFFAKLLNPSFGFGEAARIRRVRMQLLRACAETYKKLGKFQVEIVKSSKSSIESSNEIMLSAWKDWETVRTGFNTYKGMMPPAVIDAGGIIEPPKEIQELKKKEEQEAAKSEKKVDTKMEQIDRAHEEGKPEPDDGDYEKPVDEDSPKSPDWTGAEEGLMDDLHEQQIKKLAAWVNSDLNYALNNLTILHENKLDVSIFEELEEYAARFLRREKWAPLVVESHKKILAALNNQFGTIERSFRDIIRVLKERKRAQEQMDNEKRKFEDHQLKQQQRKDKVDKRKELADERAARRDEIEHAKAIQKAQQAAFKHQEALDAVKKRQDDALDKAKQKALLNVPPPASSSASDQLEVTAQAFLKKWIGKTRHQMSLFDQTSSQRLQIFEVAGEARKSVDDIMDHLEKDLRVVDLLPMIDKVNRQMTSMRGLTRNLHNTHRQEKVKK